jgi:hypothetical protein
MQLLSFLLSFVMLFHFLQVPTSVVAATVEFTPSGQGGSGTINAEIPVTKIGKLQITDGTAIIRGNTIDVVGTTPGSTTKQSLVSGVVVKTEVVPSGKTAKLNGIAYFRQGAAIEALGDPNEEELIDVVNGGTVSGHIVSINRDEVEIEDRQNNRRKIAMAQVKAIHSNRALAFTVPIAAAAAIALGTAFTGTAAKASFNTTHSGAVKAASTPRPVSSGGQGGGFLGSTLGKVIIGGAIVGGIATAIAVPIYFGTRNGGRNNERNANLAAQLAIINTIRQSQLASTRDLPSQPSSP